MKSNHAGFSRAYLSAMRAHLARRGGKGPNSAPDLGHRAVALGLETLELARIHEHALASLRLSGGPDPQIRRAETFFAQANASIEKTQRAARIDQAELKRLTRTLGQRTLALAATHRQLRSGILRRERVETAMKKSREHYTALLKQSRSLQHGLRKLTHRLMGVQEAERKNLSRELRDEVAQTLLGISARLVALKLEARLNTTNLKNEIAKAERLVVDSARSIRRVAREFGTE